jgi:hypothetical protein
MIGGNMPEKKPPLELSILHAEHSHQRMKAFKETLWDSVGEPLLLGLPFALVLGAAAGIVSVIGPIIGLGFGLVMLVCWAVRRQSRPQGPDSLGKRT